MKLGCVVLAAGNAQRFGGNKLEAALDGRSLILRALEAVPPASFDAVTVVTRFPEVLRLAGEFHFSALWNPHPELGLSHSLQMGLTALRDCDGVCFLVADQPLLRQSSVAALAAHWRSRPNAIAALGHQGVRGNPCIFPAALFPALMALSGDVGGAVVIRQQEALLELLETDPAELADVDTVTALEQLRGKG